MKEIISKELLSLVLGENVTATKVIKDNMLLYSDVVKNPSINLNHVLNLDTLGRLCKEWCLKQGVMLESATTKSRGLCHTGSKTHNNAIYQPNLFIKETELEAIIKATEWVMEQQ